MVQMSREGTHTWCTCDNWGPLRPALMVPRVRQCTALLIPAGGPGWQASGWSPTGRNHVYYHICGLPKNMYQVLQKTPLKFSHYFLPPQHTQDGSDLAGNKGAATLQCDG